MECVVHPVNVQKSVQTASPPFSLDTDRGPHSRGARYELQQLKCNLTA